VLGVVAAILAAVAEQYIPWKIPGDICGDAMDSPRHHLFEHAGRDDLLARRDDLGLPSS